MAKQARSRSAVAQPAQDERSREAQRPAGRTRAHRAGNNGQSRWVKVISHPILDELDGGRSTVSVHTDIRQAKVHAAPQHRVLEAIARMGRAGLRLMRCHVRHDPDFAVPAAAATLPAIGSHELPLALFRAGTEALEALRRHVGRGAR